MENASKALIIAGAILLSILIIGLGMMIFSQAQSAMEDTGLDKQKIDTYNADFMNYIGDRVKGTNVRTLANVVKNHNLAVIKTDPAAAPGTNNRIVTFNGAHEATAIDTARNGIKSGKMYNVTVTYNSEGLIDSVTATEL